MKKNITLLFVFLSLLFANAHLYAQKEQQVDFSKALKIGDTFIPPPAVKLMRGTDKSFDWKALEDKVVLIDFFDTFCGTCIQIMPKLQQLEKKHADKFKVITVTWQDKATIEKLFATNEYLKENKVNLPVVYDDTYFKSIFPHKAAPHEILIYKGKVHAITNSNGITEENILNLYAGLPISVRVKDDYATGDVLAQMTGQQKTIKAGTIFSGYQEGVEFESWRFKRDSITGLYKSSCYNTGIMETLRVLIHKARLKESYMPRIERVHWKVKDSTKYYNFKNEEGWWKENAICYERYDIKERPDSLQALVIMQDFLSFYGVKIYQEKRKIKCLVLKPCPVVPYTADPDAKKITYVGTNVLTGFLDLSEKFPPAVDLVNDRKIEIEIRDYNDLEGMNVQLAAYGIKGVIEDAEINVLVVEEVDY